MPEWAEFARDRLAADAPCALVSVLAVEGSTPRDAGTRMVVTADQVFGTVGGGNLEFQAIHQARAALVQPPGTWRIQDYPLGPLLAQCCGGRVRLMVERLGDDAVGWLGEVVARPAFGLRTVLYTDHVERTVTSGEDGRLPARGPMPAAGDMLVEQVGDPLTPVTLFGAGHVGVALARVLAPLPFCVDWYDIREEAAAVAGVRVAPRDVMLEAASHATGLVLILTHDHQLDYELVCAALAGASSFVGVIGSGTKRARFVSRLGKDGFNGSQVARMHCPIGLPGLRGKAPEIIAVSVAAQLLCIAQNATGVPA